MATIHDLLRPITLTKVISRIAESSNALLMQFGMGPGGPNEVYMGHGREGTYHVFNNVRSVALSTAPGTAAKKRARNPIGRVPFVYPRMHESVAMLAEEIHNISRIADPRMRDEAGRDFIKIQTKPIGQRAANWRTQMLVGMLRDSLYIIESGDNWYFTYASTNNIGRVNFGMPAGNKNQLDMLGVGSIIDVPWSNPNANIPAHILGIGAAFQQLNGGRLTDVFMRSAMWLNVTQNDAVAAAAGIANPPFQTFERVVGSGPDGTLILGYVGNVKATPGVTFHITDDGLDIGAPGSETWLPHIEANCAVFVGAMKEDNYSMYLGSEPVCEYDNAPEQIKVGLSSWSKKSFNPTATEIFTLDNALPVNHVPNSIAYGTVSGF